MESGPVCRLGNRPRMLMCYLCGREYGSRSLPIHIPQCQKKWLLEEENKPKNERRPLPPQPNCEKAIRNGGAQAFDNFNTEAYAAFEQTLEQCPHCQRRFLSKPFQHHQKGCTAAKPAKPAGTGLIPISLTNRLVPGAIAGSMHGKARTQPLPLRLCRPPIKSKMKLKMSTERPPWEDADDFSLDDRDPGQSSNWNTFCVEPKTRKKLPDSRTSFNGNGGFGGDKSHLVDTFGDLWRTHSREDNLPFASISKRTTLPAQPRHRSALISHSKQSPSPSALRSSQGYSRERAMDLIALAKTLPSGQAGHIDNNHKLMHGKRVPVDLRNQRRHHY